MHYLRVQLWNEAKRHAWSWIFITPYNNYEPQCKQRGGISPEKTLKPSQFKRILFSGSPIVQKPFLMEGCHQLVCSPVVFLNSKSSYQHMKLWSVTAFQLVKVG